MQKYKHLFFDLDRTLWDFDKNSKETLLELHQEYGLYEKMAFDVFYARYKRINGELWGLYRKNKVTKDVLRTKRFSDTFLSFEIDPDDIAEEFGNAYIKNSPLKQNLMSGTHEVLEELSKKHKLHIITNGFEEVQHIKLSNSKIDHFFDIVVCSEKVGVQKPNPKVFEYALEASNASPEESMMVGDDYEADVKGGHKAGLFPVWYNAKKEKRLHNYKEINNLKELLLLL